ncbi:hypothetical protein ACFYZ9_35405 [Streptomyces sp. NPDC001691]|uniref:hypothetical protein n=1 Tax=Streptomyces sp. NPDC001691 TaxID=3364600 RepID=UPI003678D8C4
MQISEEEACLVLLMSDGVPDQVEAETITRLCSKHSDELQTLAGALVAAAKAEESGYRDDATVVVLQLR